MGNVFDLLLPSLKQRLRPIMNRCEYYTPKNWTMTITVISTIYGRVRGDMMLGRFNAVIHKPRHYCGACCFYGLRQDYKLIGAPHVVHTAQHTLTDGPPVGSPVILTQVAVSVVSHDYRLFATHLYRRHIMSEARARLDALPNLYPKLFPRGPLPWGFEVSDGWSELVAILCARIDSILCETHGARMQVLQVKEKFGALRFYYELKGADALISGVIREAVALAEAASTHICERCGRPGEHRTGGGWLVTLCAACSATDP